MTDLDFLFFSLNKGHVFFYIEFGFTKYAFKFRIKEHMVIVGRKKKGKPNQPVKLCGDLNHRYYFNAAKILYKPYSTGESDFRIDPNPYPLVDG